MATTISGTNAVSGLGGYDTNFDQVLASLKKIEQTQLNRLEAWKSDWNLRYEAFGQVIDQVKAASSVLTNIADKNNFVTKNVNSSDINIITAVANASAQDVQHTIDVKQMASNAIWANTGYVFKAKDEIIATEDTQFNFSYAGKDYSINIAKNTTLDSFASIINNSAQNPGIKVNIVQAGGGYVFQVAGKSTGVDNDLIIETNDFLKGMSASGTKSVWESNNALDTTKSAVNPTNYIYDLVLASGAKKSVTINGNSTNEELKTALNNAAGGINADFDSNGNLVIEGVKSFSRRTSSDEEYKPAGLTVNVGSDYNKYLIDKDSQLNLTYVVTLEDGNTREFNIKGNATLKDFMVQLTQATQDTDTVNIYMDKNGAYNIDLNNVKSIDLKLGSPSPSATYTTEKFDAKGVADTQSAIITGDTTLTFDSTKMSERLISDKAENVEDVRYTIVKNDGSALYIDFSVDELKNGATVQDLYDKIKASGINVIEDTADNKLTLQGVTSFKITSGFTNVDPYKSELSAKTTVLKDNAFKTDPVTGELVLEDPPNLKFTFLKNDSSVPITIELSSTKVDGSGNTVYKTYKDILTELKNDSNLKDIIAFKDALGNDWDGVSDGEYYMYLSDVQRFEGPNLKGQIIASDNWSIQNAANAKYTIDNWPVLMESSTNSVSDAIEGVVFDIQGEGAAKISISTDITSVEVSIQTFLDAVNSVILTINELMKYDEDKEITTNDPEKMDQSNYSPSGLTNQKGGLLMGNYGVQLFKSRFNSMLTSSPPGFQRRETADNILSGDALASLANLGIKTDTDSTSSTYGLLVIAPSSSIAEMQNMDMENYKNFITNNLEDVVNFFCANGIGTTNTADFRYGSHVEGITKAGSYDVTYEVDSNNRITKVMVGGVEAIRDDSMPGNYYSVASGDAKGLSILIDDVTQGTHTGQVRIKQGLVQTTNNFLKNELTFNNVSSNTAEGIELKSKNGALMVLRDNYKTIMNNIDKSIEKEQKRISIWESRQKAIFANLETLLRKYSDQQSQLESQIGQLGGGD